MTNQLSVFVQSPRFSATLPHVDSANESSLPHGAGDPAFDIAGPAPFAPLQTPARRSRYAAVDALVTFAAIAGFISALAALGVEVDGDGPTARTVASAMTGAAAGVTCAASPTPRHGQASL